MHLVKYSFYSFLLFFLLFKQANSQPAVFPDQDCLSCHGKPEISQIMSDGTVRPLFVDPEEWSRDIHQQGKVACVDCHRNANPYLHFREGFIDVDCARCHPEEDEEYQKNIHQTFSAPITHGKELPLCFDCHTKHHVLPHDEPSSSVHETNLAETCGTCHPEIMIEGLLEGTSLGKISGHRKGDFSEQFDMRVCINCHYEDSAHGMKREYKDFCMRCHDVQSKANPVIGPTHLDSAKWADLNLIGNGLFVLIVLLIGSFVIFQSREGISDKIRNWFARMERVEGSEEQKIQQPDHRADPDDHTSSTSEKGPDDHEE